MRRRLIDLTGHGVASSEPIGNPGNQSNDAFRRSQLQGRLPTRSFAGADEAGTSSGSLVFVLNLLSLIAGGFRFADMRISRKLRMRKVARAG